LAHNRRVAFSGRHEMATIVLTAVGTLLGGPIGGAIGAALGQRIDGAIFAGKPREGPRLKELSLQTSSYGTQIPAIFGAMRVAGTVIWSTDLIETRNKSGGGKGRPSTVNYSYSASFAVALSSRPIARIGRIWADGNLLRGAADDFKIETGFRVHHGHEDQPLDPLLASAEASGQCPAHRGLAYVVFEDLQLADFGNRIPSLTFEVFEREQPVPVAEIAVSASAGAIMGGSTQNLAGYAVQGGDCRLALQPILAAMPVQFRPAGDKLALQDPASLSVPILIGDPALADGATKLDRPGRSRTSNGKAPASLSIRHYDPARDFQAGVQCSRLLGGTRSDFQIDFPASIDSGAARQLADQQLLQAHRARNGLSLCLPIGAEPIVAGDMIQLADSAQLLRVVEIEHFRGATRISASEWADHATTSLIADPGRNLPEPDLAIGETQMMLVDLPAFGTEDPGRASVGVAAAGTQAGWRRAALSIRDGERSVELGGTNGVATMGALVGSLPAHSPLLIDSANQPMIRLLHDGMTLPVGTGDPTSFDAPSLWVGGEIIRYGQAEKIAARDYRLKELLRGCFGTGDAQPSHSNGAEALLLEPQSLLLLGGAVTPVGAIIEVEAIGPGDSAPAFKSLIISGNALRPRAPVHGEIDRLANGDFRLSWVRRDRLVHIWADGADLPNSENVNAYSVELAVGGINIASWNTTAEMLAITATELAALGLTAGTLLSFSIIQQGRFARSLPTILTAIS
jgi:Putative phage tail protein